MTTRPSLSSAPQRDARFTPTLVLLAALAAGLVFVSPFLAVIGLAALMAFLFYPAYVRSHRVIKNSNLAATTTLILSGILVLIPLTIVLILTIAQLTSLAGDISTYFGQHNSSLPSLVHDSINTVNNVLAPLNNREAVITDQGVREFLASSVPTIARTVSTVLVGIVGSIPTTIILTIMYIILFVEFLVHGPKLIELIYKLSPFTSVTTKLYLKRIALMTNAMAKGQLLISVIISLLSALLMIPLGLGDFFFLLFVIFTVLNLIPLGCGILVIPIAIIAVLMGHVVPGILVLAAYLLVSNLDSIIRPKITPKGAQLSAGLTMLAAFGGISMFGLLGVIYGPVLMIIIVTTVELYASQRTVEPVA